MLRASDLTESAAAAQVAVSDIVSIKALYGFDTTPAALWLPDSGLTVSEWSRAMIDADDDGVIGNPQDYQRIAAIRLAVVARSREPDKKPGSGCVATAAAPVVFSTEEPLGVATIPITVNVDVAGAPDADYWRCYRYRAFETIVPIRNAGWRPGE
jgi:type IV pilus assembly protein PilW